MLHTGEQNCLIPGHFDPPALEPNGLLALRDHTTGSSGLIFDHHQLTGVTLLDKEQRPLLRVSCEAAPATLLWAAEAAPFICVEPGSDCATGADSAVTTPCGLTLMK